MKRVRQLSLFLENKPGVLARVCAVLARRKVNLLGISITDGHDHAVVRVIVDNPNAALHSLGAAGILVVESDVLMVNLPNRTGALGAVSRMLAHAKVNIEYSYCTASLDQKVANLILCVNNIPEAERILKKILKD